MSEPAEMLVRIGAAAELGRRGDRASARRAVDELWRTIGSDGDPFHRCALAHSAADVQDDVADELVWDLRALAAADELTDERVAAGGVASPVRGFYPSLHLNLADAYRRLGDLPRARDHLDRGLAAVDALPDDGYGEQVRGALARLAGRLPGADLQR